MTHSKVLTEELFPTLWNGNEYAWNKWLLSFYLSYIMALNADGESKYIDQEAVMKSFTPTAFEGIPLNSLFNDIARFNVDKIKDPRYANLTAGDPYSRMFMRQKYLTHTALEVKFMRDLELAQDKLRTSGSDELNMYYPADSIEFYSNLFVMYESSRDIVPRTLLIPAVVIGCIIFTLFCACISLPHPFAHLVVFVSGFMLFFEFFAIQFVLGTTINNFSMTYYFLMFLFAVEYSIYSVHLNTKYRLFKNDPTYPAPSPSPVPAFVILIISTLSFLLMLVVPLYSLVGVAIRNCICVFGIIGSLHELLFVPSLCGLVICDEVCSNDEPKSQNGVRMETFDNGKATSA